ncbi:Smr/MutS family protein [Pseudobacteriovorax antillogorgiicola]|nr:Smr/MutS family protein [Pseudobacteriovorax antillogorgiicola]
MKVWHCASRSVYNNLFEIPSFYYRPWKVNTVLGKQRKTNRKPIKHSGLFDIEEDAAEIFLSYLENDPMPIKDNELEKPKKQNRSKRKAEVSLDLHGMTVFEAQAYIDEKLSQIRAKHVKYRVRLITGKGLNSGLSGPVLASEIYQYVRDRYGHQIETIDDPPAAARINNIPIRGYFDFVIKF